MSIATIGNLTIAEVQVLIPLTRRVESMRSGGAFRVVCNPAVTSRSALGQTRRATRGFALCEAGLTPNAQTAKASFLAKYSQSSLAKRWALR